MHVEANARMVRALVYVHEFVLLQDTILVELNKASMSNFKRLLLVFFDILRVYHILAGIYA